MKHFPLFRNIVLTCGLVAAAASMSSCTALPSPGARAEQIINATNATVFSYNDASSSRNRLCTEAGPLPSNTARAIRTWLKYSTIKNFAYAYPQYYIAMNHPKTGKQIVWALCSDGQGNLVGILIPRDGVMAWDLPFVGNYRMYVCDTIDRKGLSDAIMETLSDMGYDNARIEARKAMGLSEKEDAEFLISKPLTEAEKARLEERKKKEEAARQAKNEAAANANAEAAAAVSENDVPTEDPTPDEDDTDTESEDDTSVDEISEDEATEEEPAEEESEDSGAEEEEISEEDSF